MEVSALKHSGLSSLPGSSALLRLQSDERLVALVRRGSNAAFEALVARYQSRLLAFCRHMLSSREDAEDVLQEVFTAAYNAMLADHREIHVRPWLYRIARNRSLNHLRRATAVGVDSMDVHFADAGQSTGEKVFKREAFRLLMDDVARLPESQRAALLLREMEALSYLEIAEAMDTTVPSVKSLLVRARVSLAEAAEARLLSCDEVRLELGHVAEGLARMSSPVRRHVRDCERCTNFRAALKANNRALAAILPIGPLLLVKNVILAKVGTAGAGGATAAGAGGATVAATGGGGAGLISVGAGAMATKAAAGLAAAAIVAAGAVEARHAAVTPHRSTSRSEGFAARHAAAPQSLSLGSGAAPLDLAPHVDTERLAAGPRHPSHDRAAARSAHRPAPTQAAAGSPKATIHQIIRAPAKEKGPLKPPATQQVSGTTALPSKPAGIVPPGSHGAGPGTGGPGGSARPATPQSEAGSAGPTAPAPSSSPPSGASGGTGPSPGPSAGAGSGGSPGTSGPGAPPAPPAGSSG